MFKFWGLKIYVVWAFMICFLGLGFWGLVFRVKIWDFKVLIFWDGILSITHSNHFPCPHTLHACPPNYFTQKHLTPNHFEWFFYEHTCSSSKPLRMVCWWTHMCSSRAITLVHTFITSINIIEFGHTSFYCIYWNISNIFYLWLHFICLNTMTFQLITS